MTDHSVTIRDRDNLKQERVLIKDLAHLISDKIAKDADILVFVEVKTRSYNYFGEPEDFINERKEHLLSDAASQYMTLIHHDWEIRFDIISILRIKDQPLKITHFKDAWF